MTADATSALIVGGGLTGVELAAELAEQFEERLGIVGDPDAPRCAGCVTLAVGPTRPTRGLFPGDPGAGLLPGFRDTCWDKEKGGAGRHARKFLNAAGVHILEQWAVPPPAGATVSFSTGKETAAARPACARPWREVRAPEHNPHLSLQTRVPGVCRPARVSRSTHASARTRGRRPGPSATCPRMSSSTAAGCGPT